MTYSVNITGHGNEGKEGERQLLNALVDSLEQYGGEVSIFTFSGNDLQAPSFKDAQETIYGELNGR
jgi:hypothetical protein